MLLFLLLWGIQWEATWALQHASEALLALCSKAHPEDQRRQAATKDLFQAVGSVLEASLREGPEKHAEAKGSQVGVSAQLQTSQLPHTQRTPAFLDLADEEKEAKRLKPFLGS